MEPTKLERLLISEVSGVDAPANQLDGWMVAKSREADGSTDTTIVAKIKDLLLGSPEEKEDLDMDQDTLVAILSENNEVLAKAVAEAVAKSVAPAEGEGTEEPTAVAEVETTEATEVTSEATPEVDIAKSIEEALTAALTPYNELIEKVLDRIETVESHLGVAARKSIDGQEAAVEGEPVEKSTPDLADAIASAFRR